MVGDRDRLTDLVTNLFSNAIQYNRDGGHVSVEVWPEGNEACLRVRDTGTGISADDLPRIFDRFYRADKARTAHSGGAGLGLAIAKWIVEAHRRPNHVPQHPGPRHGDPRPPAARVIDGPAKAGHYVVRADLQVGPISNSRSNRSTRPSSSAATARTVSG